MMSTVQVWFSHLLIVIKIYLYLRKSLEKCSGNVISWCCGKFSYPQSVFYICACNLNYTEKKSVQYLFYWSESRQKQYFLFLEEIKRKDAVESKIQGVDNLAEGK